MSSTFSMNDIIDTISLESMTKASISPELAGYISKLLEQEHDQSMYRAWEFIYLRQNDDRRASILNAFGFDEPGEKFQVWFTRFIQRLLRAIWRQDQQVTSDLILILSGYDPASGAPRAPQKPQDPQTIEPRVLTRLDVILLNDAVINARIKPTRDLEVHQTYVDKYGLPADTTNGKEGEDWYFHNSDETDCKLRFLRWWLSGDLVKWNEQDWSDGLYGDPIDLSISGSATGWVVQKHTRKDLRTKRSQGRPPGSYNGPINIDDLEETTQDLQDQHSNFQQPFPPQLKLSSANKCQKTDHHVITTIASPQGTTTQSHMDPSVSHQKPTEAIETNPVELRRPSKPAELSERDRQLLEDYRCAYETREEEFRTKRKEEARRREMIRTKSEEELLRKQACIA